MCSSDLKKANYMSAQGKENLPPTETITVFSEEEVGKFKVEAFSVFGNGKRKYQQAAAYVLMLNTGLRTSEALGLLNSDIDLDNRVMHVQRGVKEVSKRDGVTAKSGREITVGKLKSATSKRDIPLNDTAIKMIKDLRKEFYFGEDSPLIPDEHGEVTRPVNFRKRFYRILKAAGIETKGLHSLRHPYVKLKTKKFEDFYYESRRTDFTLPPALALWLVRCQKVIANVIYLNTIVLEDIYTAYQAVRK